MIRFVARVEVDYWAGVARAIRVVMVPLAWPAMTSKTVH